MLLGFIKFFLCSFRTFFATFSKVCFTLFCFSLFSSDSFCFFFYSNCFLSFSEIIFLSLTDFTFYVCFLLFTTNFCSFTFFVRLNLLSFFVIFMYSVFRYFFQSSYSFCWIFFVSLATGSYVKHCQVNYICIT